MLKEDSAVFRIKNSHMCMMPYGAKLEAGNALAIGVCGGGGYAGYSSRYMFTMDGALRSHTNPKLCLNARGGDLQSGDVIELATCLNSPTSSELFQWRSDGTIRPTRRTTLCLNAKGGDLQKG